MPTELILFFEVRHGDIPKRHLDGLDFHRVVCASEQNLLTRRPVDQFWRADLRVPVSRHPQLGDCPAVLRVHAVADGIAHLAQHERVSARVRYKQQRHQQRHAGGLERPAPAGKVIMCVSVCKHVVRKPVKSGADDL